MNGGIITKRNIKFLLELLRYTADGFSVCKIYQILELKKLNIKEEIIEFGSNNYKESLIRYVKKNKLEKQELTRRCPIILKF